MFSMLFRFYPSRVASSSDPSIFYPEHIPQLLVEVNDNKHVLFARTLDVPLRETVVAPRLLSANTYT